jgi:cyanuric acid amidohydrolase
MAHVHEVAKAVKEGMQEAGIEDVADIHCVEVKCPNLTPARIEDAQKRGKTLITTNIGAAGARSKGASALGVALALGEIRKADLSDDAICSNWNLYSRVASTSAGTEQKAARVLVMGNSTKSASKYVIASGVMEDSLDVPSAKAVFKKAGLQFDEAPTPEECQKLAAAFINAGVDAVSSVRGRRHTMHTDFLAGYAGIIAKAVINGIVGSLIGDTMILASAGWEHQGPRGASLLAVIAKSE